MRSIRWSLLPEPTYRQGGDQDRGRREDRCYHRQQIKEPELRPLGHRHKRVPSGTAVSSTGGRQ